MAEKVLIMGIGHQGMAMAAHLSANLVDCYLWNRSKDHIESILGSSTIICSGILNGDINVKKISTRIEDVLQKVIMVATPATAHKDIARILADYVDETYTIFLNPGRTFGILEFMETLHEYGCRSMPLIAETQTILYTCRRDEACGVRIFALKDSVKFQL